MPVVKTPLESFQSRRQKLLAWIRSQGGGIAILPTAVVRHRNRDNHYTFRHDSDFFYLSGFKESEAWLVLISGDSEQSILFCEDKNPEYEIWNGKRWGPQAAAEQFGFDAAFNVAELDQRMPEMLIGHSQLLTPLSNFSNPQLLAKVHDWVGAAQRKARGARATPSKWLDLCEPLSEMRLIKDASELEIMRAAGAISARAHVRAMQAVRPGLHEFELEAELLHTFRIEGAQGVAYDSIVATGANACVLHHPAGDSVMRDGELVLIDAGCELEGYASDITRTFPVNGRFSGAQRALYEIVLDAQRAAIAHTSPKHHWNAGHDAAVKVLTQGLLDEGLLTGTLEQALESTAYTRFYMHRTGHWLGMDVHDVGTYRMPPLGAGDRPWRMLEAGMVLTIEPGLYVRPADDVPEDFWNIGIRIEDDAVVTEQGCELITRGVPVEISEIEALIKP
ncbi:aminopeptidase P N-terminal domain-containing protein [Zwartia vadi]|uniref:aminopeptidase P N-terminal domain-containing protein n=1 Tax=Zwartia vadi TaxID=3058168 RepID=UPI0025B47830|nr:aminopeptidase P N-terminal domain-containing protein [Zwartia vadi]MDN3986039.1 aminopeptidase P N-terminal domain-containing protein [Zwartia vadi]